MIGNKILLRRAFKHVRSGMSEMKDPSTAPKASYSICFMQGQGA